MEFKKKSAVSALGDLGGLEEMESSPLKRQHNKQPVEIQHKSSSLKGTYLTCEHTAPLTALRFC